MAHKDYRVNVRLNSGEKVLKVNLKQGVDTFKILSLNINTEDTYQYPSSDYGVIVGRVLANDAFGVPNVKVSVFVPLSNNEEEGSMISQMYPFKTVNSMDDNGVQYNLIQTHPYSGIDGKHTTKGTFPSKRLVLDNDTMSEVYDKYLSFSTVTNEAGDYMIFGVPTGTCQVHFDCDLSDVGMISQRPYDLINKGYSPDLFKSPTEFNDEDVNNAVHIISQDTTVFVYPFWGDKKANQIGITRNDLNLNYKFEPSCIFMGSSITDPDGTYFAINGQPVGSNGRFKTLATSVGDIEIIRQTEDGLIEQMTENVKGIIDGNGVWCYPIPMNLDRIGTDEEGNIIAVNKPNAGIPTRARVRFRITLTSTGNSDDGGVTAKMLVPNNPPICRYNGSDSNWGAPILNTVERFGNGDGRISRTDYSNYYKFGSDTPDICFRDLYWGKVYSVKQYYPRIMYDWKWHQVFNTTLTGMLDYSAYPIKFSYPFSCISSIDSIQGFNPFPYTTMYAGAENLSDIDTFNWFYTQLSEYSSNNGYTEKGLHFCFENDWINGCLYFPKCQIIKTKDGVYQYYGADAKYDNIVYTGRHNCRISGNKLTLRQNVATLPYYYPDDSYYCNDQDNTSIYSHVYLGDGLLQKTKNNLGQNIFYYRGGCEDGGNSGWIYKMLYATDIILLGNMVDIYDSLPQLYKNLPNTTATFPPLVPPKDLSECGMNKNGYTEQLTVMYHGTGNDTDIVDIYGNWLKFRNNGQAQAEEKCESQSYPYYDWENGNVEYYNYDAASALSSECWHKYIFGVILKVLDRCALYFGYKVRGCQDFLYYSMPAFANMARICELDVHNNQFRNYKAINGIISRRDISTDENRSAFASMNYNITAYTVDKKNSHRRFKPHLLHITDFDGRLADYASIKEFKYIDERKDNSYIKFRYGYTDGIMRYPCTGADINRIENNEPLPLPTNSFYFYFGLRTGMSALDVFNQKYGTYDNEEKTNVNDLLQITYSNSSLCNDGYKTYYYSFTVNNQIPRPATYVIRKGSVTIYKGSTYGTSLSYYLEAGSYVFEVTDAKNVKYRKRFVVQDIPIDFQTKRLDSERKLSFLKIDNIENTSGIAFTKVDNHLRCSTGNNIYTVKFEEGYTLTSDKKGIIPSDSGTTLTGYISHYYNGAQNPCQTNQFFIKFGSSQSSQFTFCDIPIDGLKPWSAAKGSSRAFDSKNAQNANSNTNYVIDGKYTADVYWKWLSKMVNVVYGNDTMSISYDQDVVNYATNVISPIVNKFSAITYNKNRSFSSTTYNTSTLSAQTLNVDISTASRSNDFPHIIGQNFPTGESKLTGLRTKKNGGYAENDFYKMTDGTNSWRVNKNFFYFIHETETARDLPTQIEPSGIRSTINQVGNWNTNNINAFNIQTVDKRFDYEGVILTPLRLPSGYDNFPNLTKKTINDATSGKFCLTLYGGVRINHDSNNLVNCYTSQPTDNGGAILKGSPTASATLYADSVMEDGLTINPIKNNKHVWDNSYNDECVYSASSLNGNSSLSFAFLDCGDFSSGIISPNQSLSLNVSYDSGVELIQKTNVETDDYDVIYTTTAATTSYDMNGSLSGSTLSFKIKPDSTYGGQTYTDIDSTSYSTYEGWITNSSVKPLKNTKSLAVYCGNNCYGVTRTILDTASSYESLNYNKSSCYFPTYGDDAAKLNDSGLNACYKFTIQGGGSCGATDYIMIPTRKIYLDGDGSLLKQLAVYNSGYAYYASKLSVSLTSKTSVNIKLYTPINSNGTINYSSVTSLNGHTIGDIQSYYCADADSIEYNKEQHSFKIELTEDGSKKTSTILYFIMKNGLKYKVVIKLNYKEFTLAATSSTKSSGDTFTVTANGSTITAGGSKNVISGTEVTVKAIPGTNRTVTVRVNGSIVTLTSNQYSFNINANSTVDATFAAKTS